MLIPKDIAIKPNVTIQIINFLMYLLFLGKPIFYHIIYSG